MLPATSQRPLNNVNLRLGVRLHDARLHPAERILQEAMVEAVNLTRFAPFATAEAQ